MIDKLIEKNLKPMVATVVEKKNLEDENDSTDKTYKNEEESAEDDDEYNDEDFKIKCKNNLKLSKKIKKNFIKQQKKLDEDSTAPSKEAKTEKTTKKTTGSSVTTAGGETTVSSFNSSKKVSNKKGLATAKQRLGKLLKLNRIVNI